MACSALPLSADILYNGYIYVNERILVGPYIVYLKEVSGSGSLAVLLVMKDNAVLYPTGQTLPFTQAGDEIRVEDIVINVEEVFSTGARLSISGPSKYRIGRAGIVFDISSSTVPSKIKPGRDFLLNITLKNDGSQRAYNIQTTLLLPEVTPALFSVLQSNTVYFDFLDASTSRLAPFTMRIDGKTPSGSYAMVLGITYFDGTSTKPQTIYKKFSLVVEGEPSLTVAKVQTFPSLVRPGNKNILLTVSLENQGTDDARFVEATLDCPEPFTLASSYSQTFAAGLLKAGASVPALFSIDISKGATSGQYNLFLDVKYKDSFEGEYAHRLSFPLTIPETPYLRLKDVWMAKAVEGESFEVRLTIENAGDALASSVIVEAVDKSEQPFEYEVKSDLVGDIEPGKTGEAVLVLRAEKGASQKRHIISLSMRASGDRKEGDYGLYYFDSSFEVAVSKGVPRKIVYYVAGSVGVLLLLLALFFAVRKKG